MTRDRFAACVSLLTLAWFGLLLSHHDVPIKLQFSDSAGSQRTAAQFPASSVRSEVNVKLEGQTALRAKVDDSYGKLPLSFEANRGQTDHRVKFLSENPQYTLFLTANEAVFSFAGQTGTAKPDTAAQRSARARKRMSSRTPAVLRMRWRGANHVAKITGEDKLSAQTNYLRGNDPKKWMTGIDNYAKVKYEAVYPGIDLVYYGNQRQLEYDFVVAPGATPDVIGMEISGESEIRQNTAGELEFRTNQNELRWRKPFAYQMRQGKKQEVAATYLVNGNGVRFALGAYDRDQTLFIDPLIYSTYLGEFGEDSSAYAIAVDASGSAYVTGFAGSSFPITSGAFQTSFNNTSGYSDVFVTKFNPSGTSLAYSTFLGGSVNQEGLGIAVDGSGNAYVVGYTTSPDFPLLNPVQPNPGSGCAFVTELNPTGSALVYSTCLGGGEATSVAVDSQDNAYVTGFTGSTNFPLLNPLQPTNLAAPNGYPSAFVTKFNATGSLVYSTYLGGSTINSGSGIAVDSLGNAYVAGATTSSDFPTVDALYPTLTPPYPAPPQYNPFVSEINPSGSAFVYSTYLPEPGLGATGIAVDAAGDAYVVASGGAPGGDVFVSKINSMGSSLGYSTQLQPGAQYGFAIAVDSSGDAFVTGEAGQNLPVVNPVQAACPTGPGGTASYCAFLTELNPSGNALLFSTYLGENTFGEGVAVDSAGTAYITGDGAPVPLLNAFQSTSGPIFVAKISAAFITITGSPQQPLTKNAAGDYVANVTVNNTGNATITSVQVTISGTTLGSGSLISAPAPITNLAPGASATVALTFPSNAVSAGTTSASLKVSGTYSIPAIPLGGNWALSFRSVTL